MTYRTHDRLEGAAHETTSIHISLPFTAISPVIVGNADFCYIPMRTASLGASVMPPSASSGVWR